MGTYYRDVFGRKHLRPEPMETEVEMQWGRYKNGVFCRGGVKPPKSRREKMLLRKWEQA